MGSYRARYGLIFLSSAAGILLLALALAWTAGVSASQANGPGTGAAVSGTITDGDGAALAGIAVQAHDAVSYEFLGLTTSAGDGSYVLSDLSTPYSQVRVRFNHSRNIQPENENFVTQWYPAADHFLDAGVIAVTNGMTVTGIDASLANAGTLTVSVVLSGTGVPITNTFVELWSSDGSYRMSNYTGSTGQVNFKGIRPGVYAVKTWGSKVAVTEEWYPQQSTIDGASLITVTAQGAATNRTQQSGPSLSVESTPGARLEGKITDRATGLPVSGCVVRLFPFFHTYAHLFAIAFDDGSYRLSGLPAGHHRVLILCPDYQLFYFEVTLEAGEVLSIADHPVKPKSGGLLTGRITFSGGAPPRQLNPSLDRANEYVLVSILDEARGTYDSTFTNHSGNYSFTAVPTGTYKLFFDAVSAVDEWYDNQPSQATADTISVSADTMVTADATLSPNTGCIAGTITDGAASPLPYANAAAFEPNVSDTEWPALGLLSDFADPVGYFNLCNQGNVVQGDYAVRFEQFPLVPEWHDGSYYADGDDTAPAPVSVSAGVTVTVNGQLDTLGGCIHGTVRRPSGLRQPFTGLTIRNQAGDPVYFYLNQSTLLSQSGGSDYGGEFVACGFPTGTYTIEAEYRSIYEVLASDPAMVNVTAGTASAPLDINLIAVQPSSFFLPVVVK